MTAPFGPAPGERVPALAEQFRGGLAAPICLTWEWTSACNLPGLNLCGAGRVVCLIDPIGDVYACPFAIHDAFEAGAAKRCESSPLAVTP